MKINPFQTILLCMLITQIQSQRGGGGRGGGGGGRSGGGSSGGGVRGYTGTTSKGSSSCTTSCKEDPACIDACIHNGIVTGAVVGSILGAFLIGALIFLICLKRRTHIKCCCTCLVYRKLRKQYNVPDMNAMSQEQFSSSKKWMIDLMNGQQQRTFTYFQNNTPTTVTSFHTEVASEQPFLTELQATGEDSLGPWTGHQFILPRNGRLFTWMYKQYQDRNRAGQTGSFNHLVYESEKVDVEEGLIEGKWFYTGYEQDPSYSGRWEIRKLAGEFLAEAGLALGKESHGSELTL